MNLAFTIMIDSTTTTLNSEQGSPRSPHHCSDIMYTSEQGSPRSPHHNLNFYENSNTLNYTSVSDAIIVAL